MGYDYFRSLEGLKVQFHCLWVVVQLGMGVVALELVPTLRGTFSSDLPQGNTKHLETHLPGKLHFPTKQGLSFADRLIMA